MKVDSTDIKILDAMQNNARQPFAKLARHIGISAPAIAQRVQRMEDEGLIKGYSLLLDETLMGIDLRAIITLKLGQGRMKPFRSDLANYPEIKECYRVTGEDCLVMTVHLRNNSALATFLDDMSKYGTTKTAIIISDFLNP